LGKCIRQGAQNKRLKSQLPLTAGHFHLAKDFILDKIFAQNILVVMIVAEVQVHAGA
jgi:hypothetical protein